MLVLPTVFSSQTQASLDIPKLFPEQCLTKLSKHTPGPVALPWNCDWNESWGRHQAPPSWQLSLSVASLYSLLGSGCPSPGRFFGFPSEGSVWVCMISYCVGNSYPEFTWCCRELSILWDGRPGRILLVAWYGWCLDGEEWRWWKESQGFEVSHGVAKYDSERRHYINELFKNVSVSYLRGPGILCGLGTKKNQLIRMRSNRWPWSHLSNQGKWSSLNGKACFHYVKINLG